MDSILDIAKRVLKTEADAVLGLTEKLNSPKLKEYGNADDNKINQKSQIAIPKHIREAVGISEGDELIVDVEKNKIILTVKPKSYSKRLKGLHRDVWKGVDPKRYVKGERESWR